MGLISRIKGYFGSDVEKSLSPSNAAFFFGDSRKTNADSFDSLNTEDQLKAMANNAIVYACVMAKSTAFQQGRLTMQEKVKGAWAERSEHALLTPFEENPWLSESDLLQYIQIHLNLTGTCYLWKWFSKSGKLNELWPIPPQWVTICPNKETPEKGNRIVDGYVVDPKDGTAPIYIPAADICYLRYPDPMNLYEGLSPVVAATRALQLDEKGDNYRGEAMDALSLPGLSISIKDKMVSQEQKDDIRAVLKQKMGKDARKNALILNGSDITVAVLNPMEKFDWEAYVELNEARICSVFRVPPIVVSTFVGLNNGAWSQTASALSFFFRNTMYSEWELAAKAFTRWLVPPKQHKTLRYHFDTSEVPQMQDEASVRETRAKELYNSSVITLNEARAMIGQPALPNGHVIAINAAQIFVPADETIGVPAYELREPETNPDQGDFDIYGDQENDTDEESLPSATDPADSIVGLH